MFAYNCLKNIAFDKYKSLAYHAAPMFALSFVRTFITVIMFPRDYTEGNSGQGRFIFSRCTETLNTCQAPGCRRGVVLANPINNLADG